MYDLNRCASVIASAFSLLQLTVMCIAPIQLLKQLDKFAGISW